MASDATVNIESSRVYRNGKQRSSDALEKFEKSFSRINTPSWMKEKPPHLRIPVSDTAQNNCYEVQPLDNTKPPQLEFDNDESYNESKENLSIISRDSDSTRYFLQNAAQHHVDKSSSTGRIRYSDYRRACAALAAAVKSRNATLSSNSGSSRPSVPHSYDKWLSNRIRHHTDVHKLSNSPMPTEAYSYDQQLQDPFAVQRRHGGYSRNMSREASPAPPPFPPPPPPPPEMISSTDANLPVSNCLPGSAAVGRWSTSTLCDSAYSGNNTPTDSVISDYKSNFSTRSFLHSSSNTNMRQKLYLGWRSQDNLLDSKLSTLSNDPTQRLAYTYKQGVLSGRASVSGTVSDRGRGLSSDDFVGARSQSYSRSLPRNCFGSHLHQLTSNQPHEQQHELHESIKSVSSAIMEFCKADDVPLPPPDNKTKQRHIRTKDQHQKSRVVWMESSFVSGKESGNAIENIQVRVTPSPAGTDICKDPT